MRSLLGRFHRPNARSQSEQLFMLNNLGDGSTLSLDFTTGVLDSRLTFSRASGGTYVGNDGFVYGVDFATSSSLAIGTGSKSVTLTATAGQSRRYEIGQTVYIANGANNMSGAVTAYSAATQVLTINATSTSGSGSFTSWIVGNASARFDYDPTTLTPRGLLIEGSAVNYMLESSSLTGYSNSGMAAVSAGSETDPTGTANSARQIYATAGGTYHGFYRTITAGTNTQITVSIWAKARTYTHLFLSDLNSGRAAVRFNLSTGATDNNFGAGYVSAKTTQFPNNWWRCEMVVNVTASTAYGWAFVGVPSSGATLNGAGAQYTGTGNAADGIYCYGFQVEAGSGASSYIPTGASQGSRAADYCTMPTSSFITGNPYPNTLFVDCIPMTANSGFPNFASLFDRTGGGTFSYGNQIYYYNAATMSVNRKVSASTNSDRTMATGLAYNTRHKFATSISSASFIGSRDGVTDAGATTAPSALSSAVTHLGIGCNGDATASAVMNGWLRQIKFWPTNLPQATINSITTL